VAEAGGLTVEGLPLTNRPYATMGVAQRRTMSATISALKGLNIPQTGQSYNIVTL
jgi:hypothetical protein